LEFRVAGQEECACLHLHEYWHGEYITLFHKIAEAILI